MVLLCIFHIDFSDTYSKHLTHSNDYLFLKLILPLPLKYMTSHETQEYQPYVAQNDCKS